MRNISLIALLFCCFYTIGQNNYYEDNNSNKTEETIPYKEILLSLLGTLSAFLIWRVQHQKDKIKDIESQLSEKKI